VFYNFAPPDKAEPRRASLDAAGLCREFRPRLLAGAEAIGHLFDPIPGYTMVRDKSRASRANLVAFVREDVLVRRTWWWDGQETWARTEHPGTHPPRSGLVLALGGSQWGVGHQAPQGTDNTQAAQLEGVDAWTLVMVPWRRRDLASRGVTEAELEAMKDRPRGLLWDANRTPGEDGPGPDYLAHRIGGKVTGDKIDNLVSRKLSVTGHQYVRHAGGRLLGTDHPWGALVVTLARGTVRWDANVR
jgi:hypothetical protein